MHLALIVAPALFAAYTVFETLAARRKKALPELLTQEEMEQLERAEQMRLRILAWTGREPSQVQVIGGKWCAQVCERWVTVSDLLGERLTLKEQA